MDDQHGTNAVITKYCLFNSVFYRWVRNFLKAKKNNNYLLRHNKKDVIKNYVNVYNITLSQNTKVYFIYGRFSLNENYLILQNNIS